MVNMTDPGEDWVDLYWIPLGAGPGTHLVKASGWTYEHLLAQRSGRPPRSLFHSALLVRARGSTYAIEMGPAWGGPAGERGVTGIGSVGISGLGRCPLFRYEVRCWRDDYLPDATEAVEGPHRLSSDGQDSRQLLALVPSFPCLTWGRDELRTGDMWNSNSLVSWLLTSIGRDVTGVRPPNRGRAPGWIAGIVAASPHSHTCAPEIGLRDRMA
jgi:hypothetical protein